VGRQVPSRVRYPHVSGAAGPGVVAQGPYMT
jgi:hypothetical protein